MKTLLIDGDTVAHACCHTSGDPDHAANTVKKWMRTLGADRPIVCLSDPSRKYFRHDWWPEYKSNRKGETPPELPAVFCTLATEFPSRWLPTLEGDDVVGILATCGLEGEVVILGSDKDLRAIPGEHVNLRTGEAETIDRAHAERNFYLKILTGEPDGDGYKGLPSVGPVNAEKILPTLSATATLPQWRIAAWRAIREAFESRMLTESDALLQARLARILWACDYDTLNRRVRPWIPQLACGELARFDADCHVER
jgi:DNA polymerase-1